MQLRGPRGHSVPVLNYSIIIVIRYLGTPRSASDASESVPREVKELDRGRAVLQGARMHVGRWGLRRCEKEGIVICNGTGRMMTQVATMVVRLAGLPSTAITISGVVKNEPNEQDRETSRKKTHQLPSLERLQMTPVLYNANQSQVFFPAYSRGTIRCFERLQWTDRLGACALTRRKEAQPLWIPI